MPSWLFRHQKELATHGNIAAAIDINTRLVGGNRTVYRKGVAAGVRNQQLSGGPEYHVIFAARRWDLGDCDPAIDAVTQAIVAEQERSCET